MADLSKLTTAVQANTQAITDIQATVTALKEAGVTPSADQAEIDALTAQIETNNANLEALKSS